MVLSGKDWNASGSCYVCVTHAHFVYLYRYVHLWAKQSASFEFSLFFRCQSECQDVVCTCRTRENYFSRVLTRRLNAEVLKALSTHHLFTLVFALLAGKRNCEKAPGSKTVSSVFWGTFCLESFSWGWHPVGVYFKPNRHVHLKHDQSNSLTVYH